MENNLSENQCWTFHAVMPKLIELDNQHRGQRLSAEMLTEMAERLRDGGDFTVMLSFQLNDNELVIKSVMGSPGLNDKTDAPRTKGVPGACREQHVGESEQQYQQYLRWWLYLAHVGHLDLAVQNQDPCGALTALEAALAAASDHLDLSDYSLLLIFTPTMKLLSGSGGKDFDMASLSSLSNSDVQLGEAVFRG